MVLARRLASFVLAAALGLCGCVSSLGRPSGASDTGAEGASVVEGARGESPPQADEQRWIGGSREVVIDAPPSLVMAVLFDPDAYWSILPSVRKVEVLDRPSDREIVVRITQGVAFVRGSYTVHVRRERDDLVRLWVDRSQPRDIEEAEGVVLLAPAPGGRSRVTYQVRADIGRGGLISMVAPKIEGALLKPPDLLRSYVEGFSPSARGR